MSLDVDGTLDICMQHIEIISPENVVPALAGNQVFLYKYLDAVYERRRDESQPFHDQLLALYADQDRSKLLPLLLTSGSYDLSHALEVCQSRCLTTETIHLLNRMGNSVESLRLILQEEQDIQWAIRLCKEHDDADLWNRLIEFSLDKPEYIRELLNNIGTHINPIMIIRRIPNSLEIPGLRDALVRILHDYHLQIQLRSGCQTILAVDGSNLLAKQVATQNAALPVYGDTVCAACNKKVLSSGKLSVALFGCRHVYHEACVSEGELQGVCLVCRKDKKKLFLNI